MSLWVQALALAIPATTPLLLACMGAIISERSGVLNLGLEGVMSIGALAAIVAAGVTGNPWVAFGAGIVAGVLFMGIHAVFCITFKSDQVITGVMVTLLGVSISTYFGRPWTGEQVASFSDTTIPIIGEYLLLIPSVGPVLFNNPPTDYIAVLLVPITWYFLFRTNIGLEITAVGNDPETADTMSIRPSRIRYLSVLLAGAYAGAAGAAVTLSFTGVWTAEVIQGRGWIAVALVIVARWDPLKAFVGAYFFGILYAAQFQAQSAAFADALPLVDLFGGLYSVIFHPVVLGAYPFIFTIIALVVFTYQSERRLEPNAITEPYRREAQ